MSSLNGLTLDQFQVFVAVAEEGSFSATARRMNRAQSAVTYAIQKLEDQNPNVHVRLRQDALDAILEEVSIFVTRYEDVDAVIHCSIHDTVTNGDEV